jgi:hypothetical protein
MSDPNRPNLLGVHVAMSLAPCTKFLLSLLIWGLRSTCADWKTLFVQLADRLLPKIENHAWQDVVNLPHCRYVMEPCTTSLYISTN